MNFAKPNNMKDASVKLEENKPLRDQENNKQEILQYFAPEFVEKHKHSYLFNGIIEELAKGTNPYIIIQQLSEHLLSVDKAHTSR
jgi:hypothetical protein